MNRGNVIVLDDDFFAAMSDGKRNGENIITKDFILIADSEEFQ